MNATAPRWTADVGGFHFDPRMAAAGFSGGVTTRTMGNMADAGARAGALDRLGLGDLPAYFLKQVHGNLIHDGGAATAQSLEGDGWVLDAARRVVGIFAADCTPIYIWDEEGSAAAVLHSGWKGTRANIAAAGVAALTAKSVPAARMRAAIGPRIGACCYAVGDDFEKHFRPGSLERRGGRLFLDLGAEARSQLIDAGLAPEAISLSESCTSCSGHFFSFRREKQGTRMAALLARSHGR